MAQHRALWKNPTFVSTNAGCAKNEWKRSISQLHAPWSCTAHSLCSWWANGMPLASSADLQQTGIWLSTRCQTGPLALCWDVLLGWMWVKKLWPSRPCRSYLLPKAFQEWANLCEMQKQLINTWSQFQRADLETDVLLLHSDICNLFQVISL